ncbi:MAG: aspartate/glutamate racemase family protein [Pseudomonadota bacterium]
MHIGLIGGIGPAATVFYYERLVAAFAQAGKPLHLTIAQTSVETLAHNATHGKVAEQVAEYCRVTEQLAGAGADCVVISSMGGHFCAHAFAPVSPLPLLSGPNAVAEDLAERGIKRIGILGARVVMETGLYGTLEAFDPVVPTGDALTEASEDYIAVAIAGTATTDQRKRLLAAGERLVRDRGAQALLLGGTDLGIVYHGQSLTYPVIDSAAVHVDAIVAAALVEA